MSHLPIALGCVAWLVCAAGSALACERIALTVPAHLQTLADLQPTLSWYGRPGERFRVQVAAALPEARLLVLHDVEVAGTHWRLPEPLAVARASFKVLISRPCEGLDTQDLLAQSPWFFVDVRAACTVDPQLVEFTASHLRWAPVVGALRYSVRTFEGNSVEGGAPLWLSAEQEVSEPVWSFGKGQTGQHRVHGVEQIVSVQAWCQGHWGRPTAWRRP